MTILNEEIETKIADLKYATVKVAEAAKALNHLTKKANPKELLIIKDLCETQTLDLVKTLNALKVVAHEKARELFP